MAIFHLSVKTVSRSSGRSAVAAAAYRAGARLVCPRTGLVHDYRRRQRGVLAQRLFLPHGLRRTRQALWAAAETAEPRKNSTVARELEVALPAELTLKQQQLLLEQLARELIAKHGVAVDIAIHAPNKKGDQRNVHAHMLLTTRRVLPDGTLGEKTREWDDRKSGVVAFWRDRWAQLVNSALERAGHDARVDHRSLKEQGIDRIAGRHHGASATAIEREKSGASRRIADIKKERDETEKKQKKEKVRAQALEKLVALAGDVISAEKNALDVEQKAKKAMPLLKARADAIAADAEKRAREIRRHAAQLFAIASEKAWPEAERLIKDVVAILKEADAIAPEQRKVEQKQALTARERLFPHAVRLEQYLEDDDNAIERPR